MINNTFAKHTLDDKLTPVTGNNKTVTKVVQVREHKNNRGHKTITTWLNKQHEDGQI